MAQKTSLIIIHPSDVRILEHCSSSTASRKIALVKAALGKEPHQRLQLDEYCNYFGISYEQAKITLNK